MSEEGLEGGPERKKGIGGHISGGFNAFSNGIDRGGGLPKFLASKFQFAMYLTAGLVMSQSVNMGFFSIPATVSAFGAAIPFTAALIGSFLAADAILSTIGAPFLRMMGMQNTAMPLTRFLASMVGIGKAKRTPNNPDPMINKIPGSLLFGQAAQTTVDSVFGDTGAKTMGGKALGMAGKSVGMAGALAGIALGGAYADLLLPIMTIYSPLMVTFAGAAIGGALLPMAMKWTFDMAFKTGRGPRALRGGLIAGTVGTAAAAYEHTALGGAIMTGAGALPGGAGLTAAFSSAAGYASAASMTIGSGIGALGTGIAGTGMAGSGAVGGALTSLGTWMGGAGGAAGAAATMSPLAPVILVGAAALATYMLARQIPGFRNPDKVAAKKRQKAAAGPQPGGGGMPAGATA